MAPIISSTAVCRCGQTAIALRGAPPQSVICYCESCRSAGQAFERDFGSPVVTADGGVEYCLYRKDRVRIADGAAHLCDHRLTPQSPTRRVLASCCGAPMFLDFAPGHWLSVYRDRVCGQAPKPQMLVMTSERPHGPSLPAGIPAYARLPPKLVFKLLLAWAAMGFRRLKVS